MKQLIRIMSVYSLFVIVFASASFANTIAKKVNSEIKNTRNDVYTKRQSALCQLVLKQLGEDEELGDPCAALKDEVIRTAAESERAQGSQTVSDAYKNSAIKIHENAQASYQKCLEEHSKAGRKMNTVKEFLHEIIQIFKVNININKTKTVSEWDPTNTEDYGPISDDFWDDVSLEEQYQ